MKFEYNLIVGIPIPNGTCQDCCFRAPNSCLPDTLFRCFWRGSFKKSQSEVFYL